VFGVARALLERPAEAASREARSAGLV
jgi:hypothetical protein